MQNYFFWQEYWLVWIFSSTNCHQFQPTLSEVDVSKTGNYHSFPFYFWDPWKQRCSLSSSPPFQLWQGLFPSVVYLSAGVPSETLFRKGEDKGLLKVISYKQEIRRLPNQISPLNSSSTKFHQIWLTFFCAKLDEVDKSVGARDNLQMVKVANGSLPPKTFATFAKLLPFRLPSGFFTTAYNNFCPQVLKRFLDENSKQIFISI